MQIFTGVYCILNHMVIHINLKTHNCKNVGKIFFLKKKNVIGKYHSKTDIKTKDELPITYRLW